VAALGLGLILLTSFLHDNGGMGPPPLLECCTLFFGLLFLIAFLPAVKSATRRIEFLVTPERLRVEARGIISPQSWVWERKDIEAIGVLHGIWVAAGERTGLLEDRDPQELHWVAEALRQLLRVPESAPPGNNELAVFFDVAKILVQTPGLLRVEKGKMTLRHGFANKPRLDFVARPRNPVFSFQPVWLGMALKVSPDDLSCRTHDDGSELRVEPAGCGLVFHVTSDDPEALPLAVARFWGNTERIE